MGYDKKRVVDVITDLEKANSELLSRKNRHEQEEFLFRLAISSL
jgi:hypothetical protein